MSLRILCFLFLPVFFLSCSKKYLAFTDKYQFRSSDGNPDYSNLDYWAAHPWKWDPSDSIPEFLRADNRDSVVDVFFLYPTSHTKNRNKKKINAPIDDARINVKTDYTSILYQASVFNQHARVFAPRYRQAHISMYFIKDTAKALKALDLAYQDIRIAFKYYLENYNNGRPIIIAAHSQGSTHAIRLLKEFFDDRPLHNRLVAAYVPGMMIPLNSFSSLVNCTDSTQNNCFVGWRTFKRGFRPFYVKKYRGSYTTNPLNWVTTDLYAPRSANNGSVLTKFNKLYAGTTDAWVCEDVLWVNRPRFPWSFLYLRRNYHIGDINLFYMNIRENVEMRILRFMAKQNQ